MKKSNRFNTQKMSISRLIGLLAVIMVAAVFVNALPDFGVKAELSSRIFGSYGSETASQITDKNVNNSQTNPVLPNANSPLGITVLINEVDADTQSGDTAEFVELLGTANTSLNGLVVVFYNGSGDTSYAAFDLDGFTTNGSGFFTLGNPGVPGVDLTFPNNTLQNGADAVALYTGNASDFPNGTPVRTANLLDALVYDTGDADDAGLLVLLNAGQPQIDEDAIDSDTYSMQRCPNGSGGARNTSTYRVQLPTPDSLNTCADPTPSPSPTVSPSPSPSPTVSPTPSPSPTVSPSPSPSPTVSPTPSPTPSPSPTVSPTPSPSPTASPSPSPTVSPTPSPSPTASPTPFPTPTPTPGGGGICTPTTTVTEGNLAPGGIASFTVTSGPGSVTVDHVNAGTGLQSLTVVGVPTNATVNIPAFTPGTFNPVTVTFTTTNTDQAVDFTLRAASTFHAVNIRVRCVRTSCTPTSTVTEGDLAPGGIASFIVTTGQNSVTVDHVNAGSGLQSLTVVGTPINATVNIPAFTPGTFNPVTVTFTPTNPSQPVDFTLRAANTFHAANIRVRCAVPPPQ